MTGSARHTGIAGLLAVVAAAVLAAAAAGQGRKVWVDCKLDRHRIFEGESTTYEVQVFNADAKGPPELALADLDVEYIGSSQSMQSVNGRSTYSTTYRYRLTPRHAGVLDIPGPLVQLDGEEVRGPGLTLTVVPPEVQDDVVVDLRIEPAALYPLKPFQVELRIFVRRLPAPHADVNPLVPLRSPPSLEIPWVDPIAGLQTTEWNEWLGGKTSRQRGSTSLVGFTINSIKARQTISLFSFGEAPLAVFDLDGRPAAKADVQGVEGLEGQAGDYWVYRLDRTYVANAVGTYPFGPVRLKGTFARPELVRGELSGQDIYTVAPEVDVVVEIPEEGRPDTYAGAFGTFSLKAEVTPRSVRVGDPITLTLAVTGRGNVADLAPPDLRALDAFTAHFKIYEATAETRDQRRVFTWSLRPTDAAVTAVPPVPFSYFDVDRGRYVTLHSDPVDIDVEQAVRLDAGDIVAPVPSGRPDARVQARSEGLFANIVDPRELRHESVRAVGHALYVGTLPLVYLLAAVAIPRWRRRRQDPSLLRKRGTLGRARSRLQEGRAALSAGDVAAAAQKMRAALVGPVADAAGVPEAGLTPRDVASHLAGMGLAGDTASAVQDTLERWESLQYGVRDGDPEELARRTEELLKELSRALRREGRL